MSGENIRVALLGFGEVGQVLAADLGPTSAGIAAWDVQFAQPDSAPRAALERASAAGTLRRARSARDAVEHADLVISAVTAAQDLAAARAAAGFLRRGAWFLDLNSVSPAIKREAAALIDDCGARYVEAAVMSPIFPNRIAAPILLGGPHASSFLELARQLGFRGARLYCDEVGRASAAKMCRSVLIKGLESLLTESLLSARRHGVEQAVIDSLHDLLPGLDWSAKARYMISRSLLHGERRAEEMREAARTVAEAGLQPWMSEACARRQDWAAPHRAAADREDLLALLDQVLEQTHRMQ